MFKLLNALQYLAGLVILFLGYTHHNPWDLAIGGIFYIEAAICTLRKD